MSRGSGGWGAWATLFRLALRLHPPGRRRRYGSEAVDAFVAGMERRRVDEGSWCAHRYAARAVWDALTVAWRERRSSAPPSGEGGSGDRRWGGAIGADLRQAARRLRRAPGLTASVSIILALGVGANAAVFTVLESAVLAPLPFPHGDRLVLPRWTTTAAGVPDTVFGQWSYPKFVEFREATDAVFDELVAYARRSAAVTDPGDAESVAFEFVTPGYLEVLGATPVTGRFFARDEEGGASPPGVVVLSHAFWIQRFGGDPSAVGRTVTADGARLEIVGVAPEGFRGLTGPVGFWIPLGHARKAYGSWATENRLMHWVHALGRLRPGVDRALARERVSGPASRIDGVESQARPGERVGMALAPLSSVGSNPNARTSVWLAMAAALVVLGIAVANVAALLLARGRREARETAVRLALGAGKGRLVRERVTEGMLLAVLGGGTGVLLAAWAMDALGGAIPSYLFRGAGGDVLLVGSGSFGVDGVAALCGLGVALVAGAIFGAAPTMAQGSVDLAPALRSGGRGWGTVGVGTGGRWLVGGQVALSIVLLVGAGLLLGTLHGLHGEQRGFDPERLLVLRYSLGGPDAGYGTPEAARVFHREFRDRVRGLPGVRAAALGTTPPLSGHYIMSFITRVVGEEPFPEGRRPRIGIHVADDRYFSAIGAKLLAGRGFTPAEFERAERVTIVSRRAADVLFPGEDPVGREVEFAFSVNDTDRAFRIVGVVEDVLYSHPVEGLMPELFLPVGVWGPPSMALHVRTAGDPHSVLPAARDILRSLDPDIPFWQVTTGRELRGQDVADTRILLILLGGFAGLAVVLSTAGLWAVVARAVTDRRREIGLRVALGARPREVEGLVFLQGLGPVLAGGAVGLGLAVLLSPRMDAILYGIGPRSPAVFAGATGLLVAVALLATWLPARRAARVDPREALAAD